MVSTISTGSAVILLLFAAASVAALALSVSALLREKRQGLALSKRRAAVAAGFSVVICGLAASAFVGSSTPETKKPPPAPSTLTAEQKTKLQEEKKALLAQQEQLSKKLEQLSEQLGESSFSALPTVALPAWQTSVAGLLLVLALVAILFVDDPMTLLPSRAFRRKKKKGEVDHGKALDDLAADVAAGRYDDGFAKAADIDDDEVDRLDRLDLLLLRATCRVQLGAKLSGTARDEHLRFAIRDLDKLLAQAPNSGAATYLLALSHLLTGEFQKALDGFRRARPIVDDDSLPFAYHESSCLLSLASACLGKNDVAGATRLFEEASKLGELADRVPVILIENRIFDVRRALAEKKVDEARKALAHVREFAGLKDEQARAVTLLCDALEIVVEHSDANSERTLALIDTLLEKTLPKELPALNDDAADEFLEGAFAGVELKLPAKIFRAFFFLQAVERCRLMVKTGSVADSARVNEPLLRALQFEPRHKEVLAALGGLRYWTAAGVATSRKQGLSWVSAAVALGSRSKQARRILEQDRLLEMERRELLERFASANARFLSDPTLQPQVRKALVEELGRFQDFQPMLLDLEKLGDITPQSPTVQLLRDRARYVQQLADETASKRDPAGHAKISRLRADYVALLENLESSVSKLSDLDKEVMREVGRVVLG